MVICVEAIKCDSVWIVADLTWCRLWPEEISGHVHGLEQNTTTCLSVLNETSPVLCTY